jgi:hypothetical protein
MPMFLVLQCNRKAKVVMNKKNLVRTVVLLGLIAWPTVEVCRYYQATQDLSARLELEAKVTQRLAMAKAKSTQFARVSTEAVEKP